MHSKASATTMLLDIMSVRSSTLSLPIVEKARGTVREMARSLFLCRLYLDSSRHNRIVVTNYVDLLDENQHPKKAESTTSTEDEYGLCC